MEDSLLMFLVYKRYTEPPPYSLDFILHNTHECNVIAIHHALGGDLLHISVMCIKLTKCNIMRIYNKLQS